MYPAKHISDGVIVTMTSSHQTARAIVSHGPHSKGEWKLENISIPSVREDELLIRIVATGVCHTDLYFGGVDHAMANNPVLFYPRVLGHEGAGYVVETGSGVKVAQAGDPVLLSYMFCDSCAICKDGNPGHCVQSQSLNFVGENILSSEGSQDGSIGGSYFGQSSFSSLAVVKQRAVVNVKGLVKDDEELKLFAPLGCGVQTGAASIVNVAQVKAGQSVAVTGLGGVGLSAIMVSDLTA